jgi:DNA-binding protein WhiA
LSFSSSVKNELCRLENVNDCCLLSELAAALCLNGTAAITAGGGYNIRITTENAAFARRIFSIVRKLCGLFPEVTIRKSKKLKKHVSYMLYLTATIGSDELLRKAGVSVREGADGQAPELVLADRESMNKQCCKKAFLRGAFLAGGSISDPEKTYHLELTSRTRTQAQEMSRIMEFFELRARIIMRKGSYVTYLKEGENIVDFLNIIGAHNSLMEFENVRILKDMRNNVNRIVNCETANLEKTVDASLRQVENIRYIADNIGFDRLPANLKDIAALRLEYTDASLAELGQHLSPKLGKSGVNHRLRKLDMIAEKHREQTGRNL